MKGQTGTFLPDHWNRTSVWICAVAVGAFALVCAIGGGFAVLLATQILVLWCFGMSYQLLFGRTGMLSFGHAVNFGLAAFATAHAAKLTGGYPVYEFLPLFGAAVGLLCGAVLGLPLTRRSGIAFAMATLGIGELCAAALLMFPHFSGGESGIVFQRTAILSAFGLDYGDVRAQFYLTAVWSILTASIIGWLALTPYGLASVAVRENSQRVEYFGFNAATIRWLSYTLSSGLAGIAGALSALAYEIVTVDAVSLHTSSDVLLMTVIGGVQSIFGPLLGAVFLTLMKNVISDMTRAWLFYYAFVFTVLVMIAPKGIVGMLSAISPTSSWPMWIWRRVQALGFMVLLIVFIESAYQLFLQQPTRLPGWQSLSPAALRFVASVTGLLAFGWAAGWVRRWGRVA